MIQLVVTDLDGTLLDDNGHVSEENIEAIKQLREKNILFGIASGRALSVIEKIAIEYHFSEYVDIMIGTNGVELSEEGILEDLEMNYLRKDVIADVYDKFNSYDVAFILHNKNTLICNKSNEYTEIERGLNNYKQVIVPNFETALTKNFPRLMIVGDPLVLNEIAVQMANIETPNFHFFKSYEIFLEVVSNQVSKGNMLKMYCEHKGIDMEQVMAVGDNNNDIEMVEASGYGVAVENATQELIKHAKYITGSNNDHGFAQAIKQHIL
ncbi:MAG: hypothetical protein CVU84_05200 [Firmicutes bacterium HGW-Firmicutes-1]|jgi:hypothetical protein|nr:MAG: hypothetical protein CVU84_05200 [Firmicutes bacterium HGW-Firmicutes-1]